MSACIGTVEARYTYKIGPTFAGRVKRLEVHVGDPVKAGQVLGEMDPVDLDDRVRSQESAFKRAEAALREAEARQAYAQTQARRYEQLFAVRSTSEEIVTTKRQELQIADAALSAAREDIARTRSDREGLVAQRINLRLIAPVDGVVAVRDADPGTTIVAGQAVVEIIDPKSLWINVRFDQISAWGLSGGLPARIVLRSRGGQMLEGHVLRMEPKADPVTEETLAKVVFNAIPQPLPPVGELAEVTVDLPALPAAPLIPNTAVRREGDKVVVWQIVEGDLRITPVKLGASDLDGYVQVREGLKNGDQVVAYSEKAVTAKSRIQVVDRIPGASR
jgi:HlyD family secretion protein